MMKKKAVHSRREFNERGTLFTSESAQGSPALLSFLADAVVLECE